MNKSKKDKDQITSAMNKRSGLRFKDSWSTLIQKLFQSSPSIASDSNASE